jgi:hypothetical protein
LRPDQLKTKQKHETKIGQERFLEMPCNQCILYQLYLKES